jgi:hypothetical protein
MESGKKCIMLQIEIGTTQCDQQLTTGITEWSIEKFDRFEKTMHTILDIPQEQ